MINILFFISTFQFIENLLTNITFDDDDVWFGGSMQMVDWPEVVKEMAPFLSYTDRYTLLDVAGTDGVSPALLLTAAIVYKKEKRSSFKSHIKGISSELMEKFFIATNRTKEQKKKENDATHAISLFVDKESKLMNEMIVILKAVKTEAAKFMDSSNEILSESKKIKRSSGDETSLRWPFKMSECWMLSATHHSNEQCSRYCPKSSIDLAPNLFMGFGHDFRYFNSLGEVVASHSGYIYVHSPCKLQVKSSQFTSFYSHIKLSRRSGEYVKVGEILGVIELQREAANCNCEVASGKTECSTGPHLHWEIRDTANKPIDLNEMIVSGYQIHTGSESYDFGCGPENCHNNMTLAEIEGSCSTVFRRLSDNTTFCPSVQGANWGKIFYFFEIRVTKN